MSASRVSKVAVLVCALALLAGGCRWLFGPEPAPGPYTEANPGPWKDVMPNPPSVRFAGLKITVLVEYKARLGDYVDRVYLEDDEGRNIGTLAFNFGDPVDVTFNLPTGTRQVKVFVSSTKRGLWLSGPLDVPSAAK